MPMYDYVCDTCGAEVERIVTISTRDVAVAHDGCGGLLHYAGVGLVNVGVPAPRMGAMIVDRNERKVTNVEGHFGKEAKRRRRR